MAYPASLQDQKAQQFLATIDKDPTVGKMVDCTS
jgi:hypothetical protein